MQGDRAHLGNPGQPRGAGFHYSGQVPSATSNDTVSSSGDEDVNVFGEADFILPAGLFLLLCADYWQPPSRTTWFFLCRLPDWLLPGLGCGTASFQSHWLLRSPGTFFMSLRQPVAPLVTQCDLQRCSGKFEPEWDLTVLQAVLFHPIQLNPEASSQRYTLSPAPLSLFEALLISGDEISPKQHDISLELGESRSHSKMA